MAYSPPWCTLGHARRHGFWRRHRSTTLSPNVGRTTFWWIFLNGLRWLVRLVSAWILLTTVFRRSRFELSKIFCRVGMTALLTTALTYGNHSCLACVLPCLINLQSLYSYWVRFVKSTPNTIIEIKSDRIWFASDWLAIALPCLTLEPLHHKTG